MDDEVPKDDNDDDDKKSDKKDEDGENGDSDKEGVNGDDSNGGVNGDHKADSEQDSPRKKWKEKEAKAAKEQPLEPQPPTGRPAFNILIVFL